MEGRTYRSQGDGGCSQAYEAAISCMRLMDGISELVAELVEDSLDPGIVL